MPTVRKYAGSWRNNTGSWDNPDYLLGEPDGSCAEKIVGNEAGTYDIEVYNFGFNLPSNAVITDLRHGFVAWYNHSLYDVSGADLQARLTILDSTFVCSSAYGSTGGCERAVERKNVSDISEAKPVTADDLNTENFTFIVRLHRAVPPYGIYTGYVDACFIDVEYTVPVAKKILGDGIIFVEE